ncbi:hypothetical protein PUN28_002819 [Cardiocondyla obscurior]|uniref:Secreted protein n=1 Tax=Cardiocondyla obscurior TaxID=286306 RepID=A0AAW2GW59_9HYME
MRSLIYIAVCSFHRLLNSCLEPLRVLPNIERVFNTARNDVRSTIVKLTRRITKSSCSSVFPTITARSDLYFIAVPSIDY